MEGKTAVPLHTKLADVRPYLSGKSRMVLDRIKDELDPETGTGYWRSAHSHAEQLRELGFGAVADEVEGFARLSESLGER